MGKFAIECPKCGSINTASTFIFAKKVIRCGTCGEEINIKQSRLTSKICPHCGKVFVCDQAKAAGKKCPSCGEPVELSQMATAQYKMTAVNCPQCACSIEVDKTKDTFICPICDYELDVKKELAKAELVKDTGISVIQYEGDNSTFVWKHLIEDFNLGSQLIVHESQEAIFFLNGEALDTFGPGRHTLETENIPILKKIYSLPTGKQTPFHAEVYFINKAVKMGMKWGTDSRVRFIDPITGIPLDIGASGELNLQVADGKKLLIKLVGTTGGLTTQDILDQRILPTDDLSDRRTLDREILGPKVLEKDVLSDSGRKKPGRDVLSDTNGNALTVFLRGFFRAPLMTEIKSYLAAVIREEKINILEIDEHMSRLSEILCQKISPRFEEYGLTIPQFYITNISLPEDDPNFKNIKALISKAYLDVKAEEVLTSVAEAAKKRKVVEAQTAAELDVIRAQGEAEAAKAKGLAEAEVMQAKGYTGKDVLSADVQKAWAEGVGNMGSGGSGGGGLASDLIGMMAGMKMAGTVLDQMNGSIPGAGTFAGASAAPAVAAGATTAAGASGTWTCSCGETGNVGKFCMSCGKPKAETWDCPSCGHKGNKGRFCEECGAPKPESWDCPACGSKENKGKFCAECGAKKPE